MFKVITNKKDFIKNPVLEMNEIQINNSDTDIIRLFGKEYRMYADEWKHHVHIKCTDRCDSNCSFCIERSERNNPQNTAALMSSTKKVLTELQEQGHLKTVSITGGEPTMFNNFYELVELISSYNPTLLSVNTNGRYLSSRLPKNFNGWVNISKHSIDDTNVFNRDFLVTSSYVTSIKRIRPDTKVRFQCVLGVTCAMDTISNIIDYIREYKNVVDDFSFRNLIIENDETKMNSLLFEFRDFLLENGEFVEQVIQDYYVYETFKMFGTQITLSWSNMKALKDYNESHDSNFLEEIIVHPDGMISGSWNKKSLIIFKPESTDGNEYIPCRGENCNHRCPRYDNYLREIEDEIKTINGFKSSVSSCSVTSCSISSCS